MSGIPREILKWLQGLDLSYSIKNPERDLANGFLVAEILSRRYEQIKMHSFDNGTELRRKLSNWEHLERIFTKLGIPLGKKYWEPVLHCAPGAGIEYLKLIYTHIQQKEVVIAPPHVKPKPPPYARPIAVNLLRDTEFQRIEDKKTKDEKAYSILNKHNENIRLERTEPGRLALPDYTMRTQGSTKKAEIPEDQSNIEIRQVAVRAMDKNMRAAKALSLNKTDTKQENKIDANLSMIKPALEILSRNIIEILQLITYKTIWAMEFRDVEHGEEFTRKFYSIMGQINQEFVNACFDNMVKKSNDVSESLIKSAQEYEIYADLMINTIETIRIDSEIFPGFLKSLKAVGHSLTNLDSNISKQLLSHFLLGPLVRLIRKSPEKISILVTLVYSASHSNSMNRLQLAKEIFETCLDYCFLTKFISELIDYDSVFYPDLHEYYRQYALLGLSSSSPRVQASAVCILGSIAMLSPEFVLEVIDNVKILLDEN